MGCLSAGQTTTVSRLQHKYRDHSQHVRAAIYHNATPEGLTTLSATVWRMASPLDEIEAEDGAVVDPGLIPVALTVGRFQFEDGATQVFNSDGTTTYTEHGRPSEGSWYVEGQLLCSFWPPSYTGCYQVTWLVEAGRVTGLHFVDQGGTDHFVGRYMS